MIFIDVWFVFVCVWEEDNGSGIIKVGIIILNLCSIIISDYGIVK